MLTSEDRRKFSDRQKLYVHWDECRKCRDGYHNWWDFWGDKASWAELHNWLCQIGKKLYYQQPARPLG